MVKISAIFSLLAVAVSAAQAICQPEPAGAGNVGNGNGLQFIGAQCISDADCASGCCATCNDIGICSGFSEAFINGKDGCGFSG